MTIFYDTDEMKQEDPTLPQRRVPQPVQEVGYRNHTSFLTIKTYTKMMIYRLTVNEQVNKQSTITMR